MNRYLLDAIEKLEEGTSKPVHLTPTEAAALLERLRTHTIRTAWALEQEALRPRRHRKTRRESNQ